MRRFICWLLGHKDAGMLLQVSSGDIRGYVHNVELRACRRCIAYKQMEKIPSDIWLSQNIDMPDFSPHRTLH